MKSFGIVLGWIVAICAMALVVKIVVLPFFVADTVIESGKQVFSKTMDADNVLQNYEWFKQEYQDFLAINQKVKDAKANLTSYDSTLSVDRSKWSETEQEMDNNLRIVVSGLQSQRNDIISQYNAKSQMQNRALFKTKDLPAQLSQDDYSVVGGNFQ